MKPRPSKLQRPLTRLDWRGLTPQLFLLVVLPLTVLLVVVAFGSLSLHGQAMRDLVTRRDEQAARTAAAALSQSLTQRASAIHGLAQHLATTSSREGSLTAYAFLLSDFDGGLAVFSPDGQILDSTIPNAQWATRPVTGLLRQTIDRGEPRFSPVFAEEANGQWSVLVASSPPVSSTTSEAPIVVGAFFLSALVEKTFAFSSPPADQPFIWLVDASGQVLYQMGTAPEEDLAHHPGVAEALAGQSGGLYRTVDGNEHVIAFSPVWPVGWALVMEEPWEEVDNPLLRQTLAAPLILVPVLIFAVVALGFGIRQIIQPLRKLEQRANQLAEGRFAALDDSVGGIAEIRRLQAELVRMAHTVNAAQQSLRHYLGAVTSGQEDERRRLARELHDGAVQSLVALDQRAQLAQLALKDASPEIHERLADMRRMTVSLIEEVRRVIRALRPNYLEDLGLLPALEMLTRDLQTIPGPQLIFTTRGQPRRLTPAQEIAIYRMVQEALHNATRHASAQQVSVTVTFELAELMVRVQDNGKGFAAPERLGEWVTAGHYGLMGMQERAELIGAQLSIRSASGAGTTIEVRLPVS